MRPFPKARFPASDYYDSDPAAPDKTYCRKAGLLDGFTFDPAQYRIPRSTFESADIVHWLALKVALASLDDAGFSKASVPRERTGVILGNTLTGEYSRAEGMRLRWPFVRRVLKKAALEKGLSSEQAVDLLRTAEAYYKSFFTPITEDTLAGALSNTIAGRICNYLDLHGGGYTVDGACSSSIIATATAATHLVNRDLDLALAGGVDISLDAFELVGFAKTAALATEDMRVYDRRANGFMPGEGCGFVVMKRLEDAVADGDYVYAVLHGWGISSDGKGGLTAPNAQGQARALQRAYQRAGWSINDVDFIEGHGTGTAVGDKTELEGIALAMKNSTNNTDKDTREDTSKDASSKAGQPMQLRPCGITSLKSLIGHTKAASGVGALIKTVIALNQRILPPLANCFEPNSVFADKATNLYPLLHGEIRPPREILQAGVSGMGFGGINSHLALASGDAPSPKLMPAIREQKLLADYQRTELFVFSAPTIEELLRRVQAAEGLARNICEGERLDFAAHLTTLYGHNTTCGPVRAAVIAESPDTLLDALAKIVHILRTSPPKGQQTFFDPRLGICIGNDVQSHRVGFLFPGQGSQKLNMGHQLVQRHDWARDLVKAMDKSLRWPEGKQLSDFIFRPIERALDESQVNSWQEQLKQTDIAQPALCLASMLRLEQLARLGIHPEAVGGHSLGELTAFYAAGAYSREELIGFAALRGEAMTPGQGDARGTEGIMASLACSAVQAQAILDAGEGYAVVANKNSPSQTVISGEPSCIQQACRHAEEHGIRAVPLPVANAFHSRFVSQAAQALAESRLLSEHPKQLTTRLFSGLQRGKVDLDCDLRRHFAKQVISPVDFISLIQEMSKECDLLLEVGPGRVLTGLARSILANDIAKKNEEKGQDGPTCFPLETKPEQDRDLNVFLANYFVRGGTINWHVLYDDRLVRPFTPADERLFLTNPCERPFPEHFPEEKSQSSIVPSAHLSGQGEFGKTDHILADIAGISERTLAFYLERRSQFLGSLIRVDIDNMSEDGLLQLQDVNPQSVSMTELSGGKIPSSADQLSKVATDAFVEVTTVAQLLFDLIEQQTGFPKESLSMEFCLLDDLNLDSIKASELIAEAAAKLGIAATQIDVAEYANASLAEIAEVLEKACDDQAGQNAASDTEKPSPAKYPLWVRDFTIAYSPEPLAASRRAEHVSQQSEKILILSEPAEQRLAEQLKRRFADAASVVECASFAEVRLAAASFSDRFTTVIVLLPRHSANRIIDRENYSEHVVRLHTVFSTPFHISGLDNNTLAVIQFGEGFFGTQPVTANIEQCSAKSLAASMHLEKPALKIRVLDFCPRISPDELCARTIAELSTTDLYAAAGYDAEVVRRVPRPVLQNTAMYQDRQISWSAEDVFLVTGGAKGITAECALELARTVQVQMVLVGSSAAPQEENEQSEIARTLRRFQEINLPVHYYQCDITDADAVYDLVRQIRTDLGEITGVIHGSALNRPGELGRVSVDQALKETAPKLAGAINLCAALQDRPPKLFVAFSSITGVSGMIKNGWYGFSNEALELVVQQYGERFPQTSVLSIAFSIWGEVGMGIKMGSTAWLGKMGMDAIPVQEGTARFLRLVTHYPFEKQVVVTARPSELDTFAPPPLPVPENLQFLEEITVYSQGIELISRTRLTLERDPYVKDHIWRGTYLFPMVFGLEAMAQAVRAVTGTENFDTVTINNIELERPITLTEETATEIEIHAQVLEQSNEGAQQVHVQIRSEHTGFNKDHFSATFVLTTDRVPVQEEIPVRCAPLDIASDRDLYNGRLLFQGPLFQRIQQTIHLASDVCLFRTGPHPETIKNPETPVWSWYLGDPFLRDALLQVGQIAVPKDLALPRKIESIERFPVTLDTDERLWIRITIERRTAEDISGTVTLFNKKGQLVERMKGYFAKFMEHREDYPTAEEMAHPGQRDEWIMQKEIKQRALSIDFIPPEIGSCFIPCLKQVNKRERRKQELLLLQETVRSLLNISESLLEFSWSDTGGPYLASPDVDINISLAHNESTVLCTAGQGVQGCDLETVSARSREDWVALLSRNNSLLLNQMIEEGDTLDRAGTRIWTALEAAFKALGGHPQLSIVKRENDGTVLFQCGKQYSAHHILTFPVTLTLKEERMLAVMGQLHNTQQNIIDSDELLIASNNTSNEFTTTFVNSRGAGGKVYFTNIPVWMGELRELALSPISEQLLMDMKSRQWGMVTSMSSFKIERYLDSYDAVIGEVRLMDDTDLTNSIISLAFNWSKKEEDGTLIHVASGKLLTTWVSIEQYGIVKKAPLPDYLNEYLAQLPPIFIENTQWLNEKKRITSRMASVFAPDIAKRKKYFLEQQEFLTSMEDSNLVGNIYFSQYYSWQARLRDHYLFTRFPEIFQWSNKSEFVCIYAEVNHLQEAMPFETIEVSMYLYELFAEGFTLYFEYYSVSEHGTRLRKLAHGDHSAVWIPEVQELSGEIHPAKIPEEYMAHFMTMIDNSGKSHS